MHELPLCEAVLDVVVADAAGRHVERVAVTVGAGHAPTEEAFATLFARAAAGTVAADAAIDLTIAPSTYACAACGSSGTVDARIPLCPECDGPVRPRGGDGLSVTAISYLDEPA